MRSSSVLVIYRSLALGTFPSQSGDQAIMALLMSVPFQASKSRFVVGSHVWVEDPDEAWMDGLVEEINGDELVINCTSGKKVN